VAAERVKEINPNVNVYAIHGDVGNEVGLGVFKDVDAIIGCLDSRHARFLINQHAFRANRPWIDGGIENLEGNVRIFQPGVNCYECSLSETELNQLNFRTGCPDIARFNFVQGRVATTPVSASVIGGIQTQEALKIIHGYHKDTDNSRGKTLMGRMFKYDGMFLTAKNYKLAFYNDDCMSHDIWEPVVKCEGLKAEMKIEQVLKELKKILKSKKVTIHLMNTRFVYRLTVDSTEKEIEVRLPESKVADFIEDNAIKEDPLDRVYQEYLETIDDEFPFKDLSLKDVGFPPYDIVMVSTPDNVHYIELTGDREIFGFDK
jgi:adenylyltransferase/sulfurtransferase